MPQIASPDSFLLKIFWGGIPPNPPRGSCPLGTRNTPTAYFQNLADYFQIYGEHCSKVALWGEKSTLRGLQNCWNKKPR